MRQTHSHLDHVTSIPFLVDTVGWMRNKAITVHAIEPTLEILRQHLFNWKLWPDFTQIPDPHKLNVKSWVSGEARQDYSTEHMAHTIPEQIAWLNLGRTKITDDGLEQLEDMKHLSRLHLENTAITDDGTLADERLQRRFDDTIAGFLDLVGRSITHYPCINCVKILAASGIAEIRYRQDYHNDPIVAALAPDAGVRIMQV